MRRDILHRFAHIEKRQSLIAADVQDQAFRPVQLPLDKRAFDRALHRLDDAPETPRRYHNSELVVLRSGKGSRWG